MGGVNGRAWPHHHPVLQSFLHAQPCARVEQYVIIRPASRNAVQLTCNK
jgi:hypothetical protein